MCERCFNDVEYDEGTYEYGPFICFECIEEEKENKKELNWFRVILNLLWLKNQPDSVLLDF